MAQRLQIRVSQRQLALLLRVAPPRIDLLTQQGVIHRIDGSSDYDLDAAVGEWLEYERGQSAKSRKRGALERERVRLTRAKATRAERQLAILDGALINHIDIIEEVRAACLRIRSRLQAALSRIARSCHHAPSLTEAMFKVRSEFELLLSELSTLQAGEDGTEFKILNDESVE